jgi:DNA-binding SARP family transcriptional activator
MAAPDFVPSFDDGLTVSVLNGFSLSCGQRRLGIPRASQRLVAFLALHGRTVKRAAVAGALWPDTSESHAYSNLRSAIARLERNARKVLVVRRLDLGLAVEVSVDLRLARLLAGRLLDPAVTPERSELGLAAVGALSRDLLPDWYEEWVLVEAEDWRQLRLHALEALAGRFVAVQRWGEAVGAANAAVRAEPLRESARAALIQAHLAHGNQSEAVREFVRYRALLGAELGIAPTPRLRGLVEALDVP